MVRPAHVSPSYYIVGAPTPPGASPPLQHASNLVPENSPVQHSSHFGGSLAGSFSTRSEPGPLEHRYHAEQQQRPAGRRPSVPMCVGNTMHAPPPVAVRDQRRNSAPSVLIHPPFEPPNPGMPWLLPNPYPAGVRGSGFGQACPPPMYAHHIYRAVTTSTLVSPAQSSEASFVCSSYSPTPQLGDGLAQGSCRSMEDYLSTCNHEELLQQEFLQQEFPDLDPVSALAIETSMQQFACQGSGYPKPGNPGAYMGSASRPESYPSNAKLEIPFAAFGLGLNASPDTHLEGGRPATPMDQAAGEFQTMVVAQVSDDALTGKDVAYMHVTPHGTPHGLPQADPHGDCSSRVQPRPVVLGVNGGRVAGAVDALEAAAANAAAAKAAAAKTAAPNNAAATSAGAASSSTSRAPIFPKLFHKRVRVPSDDLLLPQQEAAAPATTYSLEEIVEDLQQKTPTPTSEQRSFWGGWPRMGFARSRSPSAPH